MTTKRHHKAGTDRVAETMAATTAHIVDAIERGLADPDGWVAPWQQADPAAFTPRNAATGAEYTGGNRMNLAMQAMAGAAPVWATFNQWRDLGYPVGKGCTARTYVLRRMTKTEELADGTERTRVLGYKAHAVWSADQVGYPVPVVDAPAGWHHDDDETADMHAAFTWAASVPVHVIEHPTAGASYSPTFDQVTMPERDRFDSAHALWSTLAHECTHWTGHTSRLAREFGKKFGDDAYAAEELCAELGSAFTLAAMGRTTEPRPDHARYLAHWLRVLRSRPDALWTVASKAEAAAAYLAERADVPALADA